MSTPSPHADTAGPTARAGEGQPAAGQPAAQAEREVVLELRETHRSFGDMHLFRGINLKVHRGESVVVMGRSGSGKSVLIKLLNGLLPPTSGQVLLFGRDTATLRRRELMELRTRIGTLFQNYALFDSYDVVDNVAFPLIELHGTPARQAREQAQELLATLGLEDAGALFPASLSGGMKKRVSLARALITRPEVVLFDEPTTGLDPVMIEFVDQMLIDARERFNLTSVLISHDMASAFNLADRMAMIHDGHIDFDGTPDEARTTTVASIRAFIDAATSRLEPAPAAAADGADTATTDTATTDTATTDTATTDTATTDTATTDTATTDTATTDTATTDARVDGPRPTAAPEAPPTRSDSAPALDLSDTARIAFADLPTPAREPLLTVEDVYKTFGDREVLRGASFYVMPEAVTTLIGGSGSGKTVLMKHVLGLFRPTAGRITVFGTDITTLEDDELLRVRQQFGMLFQSAALFDSMSVVENVMFPLVEGSKRVVTPPVVEHAAAVGHDVAARAEAAAEVARRRGRSARERAMSVLEKLGIADLAGRMPSDISNGQRKRVGLARAIVTDPQVIIYDEPTTGLDPVMTAYVNDMIVEATETFRTTGLVVSHDMASTFRISQRVAMLYKGAIIAFGSPEELRDHPHPRVREFIYAGAF